MSTIYTTIGVTRKKQQVPGLQNIDVQIDSAEELIASGYEGSEPHRSYTVIDMAANTYQPDDILTDTTIIDPETNELTQYLVVSDGRPSIAHTELTCNWYDGS